LGIFRQGLWKYLCDVDTDIDEGIGDDHPPTLLMDQSINSGGLTFGGMSGKEAVDNLNGGEFSVFAMNRNRERFIDRLTTWENIKQK
jgi:hypothetical protein